MLKLIIPLLNLLLAELEPRLKNKEDSVERFYRCIKAVESGSSRISSWSFTIMGGTFLAILSDSYVHPESGQLKLFYLLFLIGWFFIAASLRFGMNISGRSIASELSAKSIDDLVKIFEKCNDDYSKQIRHFKRGLVVFGLWLVLYLIWWIFFDFKAN